MGSRRWLTLLGSLLIMSSLTVHVVSAAPTNAPNAEAIPITCDNGASYTVISNGNGTFTPGHIIDDDGRVLIPVAFVFEGMDSSGNVIFSESVSKKGKMKGLSDDLIVCTFGGTFEENGETFTFTGTVTLFVAPRG